MKIPRTFPNSNSQDWGPNLAHQNQFSKPTNLMTSPAILQSSEIQQDYQRFNNYNLTTPRNDPISAAQHFADNFGYQSQSNVPPCVNTYKGLPSQKGHYSGQSGPFHQFVDVAPTTYYNAPYTEDSSQSFNPAQSYAAGPEKSYLASPNNFQRGFPDVQTDPVLQLDFQSTQIPPFNQYDDWKFRTEQNPIERSESQFHAGFFDNKGFSIQPSISLPNSDRSEEILRRSTNIGSRLDMLSSTPNEIEQEAIRRSKNFEQALDLTSTTTFTQENHGNKSHLFSSVSSFANPSDFQSNFTFNIVTEAQREQREKVARYFSIHFSKRSSLADS